MRPALALLIRCEPHWSKLASALGESYNLALSLVMTISLIDSLGDTWL